MNFVPKWKISTQAALFKDCLHVKIKIINHKSQSSPIDGLRFMDICPQKSFLDLKPSGIFAQWITFRDFYYKKFIKNLPMENGIIVLSSFEQVLRSSSK